MKTSILCLLSLPAITAFCQQDPVTSDVYSAQNAKATKAPILSGPTRFLETLEIHTATLAPNATAENDQRHDDLEELIIVKSGTLTVTQNSTSQSLGPGSVALTLPGDTHSLANKSASPVTYYVLTYKSKGKPDLQRGQTSGGSFMVDRTTLKFQEHGKGGIRRYYNRPTAMFERMEMHVTTLNKGLSSHDPHTHKADEIVLLVSGKAEMHIDGNQKPVPEGALAFLGSMVPHAITNTGTGPCEYFAFQWE
jgi:(S)-ureidoglycine aminohydrolase